MNKRLHFLEIDRFCQIHNSHITQSRNGNNKFNSLGQASADTANEKERGCNGGTTEEGGSS